MKYKNLNPQAPPIALTVSLVCGVQGKASLTSSLKATVPHQHLHDEPLRFHEPASSTAPAAQRPPPPLSWQFSHIPDLIQWTSAKVDLSPLMWECIYCSPGPVLSRLAITTEIYIERATCGTWLHVLYTYIYCILIVTLWGSAFEQTGSEKCSKFLEVFQLGRGRVGFQTPMQVTNVYNYIS